MNQKNTLSIDAIIAIIALALMWSATAQSPENPTNISINGGHSNGIQNQNSSSRSIKVTKVAVYSRGDESIGVTGELVIKIDKNEDGRPAVGIMEDFSGGVGKTSKGSAWVAVLFASAMTGIKVEDYEFTFKSYGFSDGPSAGMLTTAALIALLKNESIRADTTITGTINPDGSCGPVGGIQYKMEGAAKAGLKRFGFPTGSRMDHNGQDLVGDLKKHGENLGLEVKEIDNIHEAYEWMTGKVLPRTEPIDRDLMDFTTQLAARLSSELTAQVAELRDLSSRLPSLEQVKKNINSDKNYLTEDTLALLVGREELISSASKYLSDGQLAAAQLKLSQALVASKILLGNWDMMSNSNMKQTNKEVLTFSASKVGATRLKVQAARQNATANAGYDEAVIYGNTLAALLGITEAEGFVEAAQNQLRIMSDIMAKGEELANLLPRANPQQKTEIQKYLDGMRTRIVREFDLQNIFLARAEAKSQQAAKVFLVMDDRTQKRVSTDQVITEGRKYSSGGSSVLTYFEALHLESLASRQKESLSTTKEKYQQGEPLFTSLQMSHSEIMRNQLPNANSGKIDLIQAMDATARGAFCYLGGSGLLIKTYALGGDMNRSGELTLKHRKSLGEMLRLAESRLLERANLVFLKLDTIPHAVKFNYQLGNAFRDSNTDQDKFNALSAYWQGALICDSILSTTN
jgi:predicted S18 family serine protease